MANCCKKKTKTPLTVEVMDRNTVLTPENAGREVLLLGLSSAGTWVVRPAESLTLKALRYALDDPRTAFLLLSDKIPETPDPDAPEDGKDHER